MSIKEWPASERPREKLLEKGAEALSDAELLAILLRVGIRGMSAVDLARYLLQQFGSLGRLMNADATALSQHKGMGIASYAQFAVVREIGRRVLMEDVQNEPVFQSSEQVENFLRLKLGHERVEVTMALLLNRQHRLIRAVELSRGTVAENMVYVREVVKLALDNYADALILAHNHPGGLARPSENDVVFTQRLHEALGLVEVRLLDHFIITATEAYSFAAHRLL